MESSNNTINLTMLVDDNDIDSYVSHQMIKQVNFSKKIELFSSGSDALRYLEEHQDQPEALPEVIFLDMYMPDADAFFFIRQFENFTQSVKDKCRLVVLSSVDNKEALQKIIQNKYVVDVMSKPIDKELLLELKMGNQHPHITMMKRS